MDPVSLIVTALIAGTTRSLEGVAENSLKDAYTGLKDLLKRFFTDRPAAQDVLEKSEADPKKYGPVLEDYVQESGAAQDAQILEAAQKLLTLADPEGTRKGQYEITIQGDIRADRGGIAAGQIQNAHAGYRAPSSGDSDPT